MTKLSVTSVTFKNRLLSYLEYGFRKLAYAK